MRLIDHEVVLLVNLIRSGERLEGEVEEKRKMKKNCKRNINCRLRRDNNVVGRAGNRTPEEAFNVHLTLIRQ